MIHMMETTSATSRIGRRISLQSDLYFDAPRMMGADAPAFQKLNESSVNAKWNGQLPSPLLNQPQALRQVLNSLVYTGNGTMMVIGNKGLALTARHVLEYHAGSALNGKTMTGPVPLSPDGMQLMLLPSPRVYSEHVYDVINADGTFSEADNRRYTEAAYGSDDFAVVRLANQSRSGLRLRAAKTVKPDEVLTLVGFPGVDVRRLTRPEPFFATGTLTARFKRTYEGEAQLNVGQGYGGNYQCSAPTARGFSGGAVLDGEGRMIGLIYLATEDESRFISVEEIKRHYLRAKIPFPFPAIESA